MSLTIHWLSQKLSDVQEGDAWLCAAERSLQNGMRFAKRRNDWRLGRWTAKCAVLGFLPGAMDFTCFPSLEIRSAADGAPEPFLDGMPAPVSLSISHSADVSLCAVAVEGVALGCDLEVVEQRETDFFSDYFTAEEWSVLEKFEPEERSLFATLIWSAKESALKSLREGLRRDTRSVDVRFRAARGVNEWNPLSVICGASGRIFDGWWQLSGRFIQTLTADRPSAPPEELRVPSPPDSSGLH